MEPPTPPPFIGRAEVLAALRERHQSVAGGHGAVSVLEGDSGVGKSTLLNAFLEECRLGGDRVLRAAARRAAEPPPFQLIREALGGEGPTTAALPDAGTSPARSEARLSEVLRSLNDVSEPVRSRVLAPLAEPLYALSRRSTTILAIENIAWADLPSLEFLAYLAPFLPEHRLWVILSCVPIGELPEAARKLVEGLPRGAATDRWTVRPLAPAELAEFVHWVDPTREVRPTELTHWFTQTGGNPLFLEQLLRAGHRNTPSLWDEALAAGRPVAEFLHARLAALPEDERRVLACAAVIGRDLPFRLLLQATGFDEERLAETVEKLVERGLLREVSPEMLEFSRGDLREIVYSELTESLRRIFHQKVAEALEMVPEPEPDTLFALTHHSYLGRLGPRAITHNRRAAEFAAHAMSPEIARTHLERALEVLRRDSPEERAHELEIVVELALALDRVGELERAEAILREALARDRGGPPTGGVASELLPIYLARILTDEGRWDEARKQTDHLLDHPEAIHSSVAELALHRLRGEIEYYRGSYQESLQYQDRALDIARAQGDYREMALVIVRRANALAMIPDSVEEAIPAYREASEELLRLGDRAEAAYALLFLGVTLSQHGRTDEGLEELRNAAQLAEESSDLRQLGWALFNIADLLRDKGDLETARSSNARSRQILERIGDQFGLAQTYIIAGKIGLASHDLSDAERELLEAFRIVRQLRTEPDELEVLLRLAEVAEGQGDGALARERLLELERRVVHRLRPDLSGDVRRLSERLNVPVVVDGSLPA